MAQKEVTQALQLRALGGRTIFLTNGWPLAHFPTCFWSVVQIKSIVLINAGGTADVIEIFQAEEEPGNPLGALKFYVIDSHRPVHLANCYDQSRVFVFDDGQTQESIPDEEEVLDTEDEEGDPQEPSSKRRRLDLSPGARADRRLQREHVQKQYYSSTSYGLAVSTLMWQLAGDIGKTNNHLLWLAIVGVTDQFIHERVDVELYSEMIHNLSEDVKRMNAIDAEVDDREATDRLQIKQALELRFMLLRHWTLFEAMVHSRYVAARLGVWRGKGKDRLKDLLAKMGIALDQCQQKFTTMDVRLRESLFDQINKCAPTFGLDNCAFDSFVSQHGFQQSLSASDVVYAVTALLEAPTENDDWRDSFYRAYDALAPSQHELLVAGMDLSMQQHIGILRLVESIVDGKNGIRKTTTFRYAVLNAQTESRTLAHPITLCKLAYFLLDTYRFNKESKKKTLPLVLAALNPVAETYLVVGVWTQGQRMDGVIVPNQFGVHFQAAGQRINARLRMTAFDSSGWCCTPFFSCVGTKGRKRRTKREN